MNSLNLNILNRATLSKKSRATVKIDGSIVVVCPNPRCQRGLGEPILLTILSVMPPKQYEACPYCFAKLEQEAPIEQEAVTEPTTIVQEKAIETEEEETAVNLSLNTVLEKVMDSGPSFFKKFKALIPRLADSKKRRKGKQRSLKRNPSSKKKKRQKKNRKQNPLSKKKTKKRLFKLTHQAKKKPPKRSLKPKNLPKKKVGRQVAQKLSDTWLTDPKAFPSLKGA